MTEERGVVENSDLVVSLALAGPGHRYRVERGTSSEVRALCYRSVTTADDEVRPVAEFSLQLNEDQLQIQKWVHDFAENVVRPAGHEWDEREETPWPIIEEAAKIGLYSFDFFAQAQMSDPTGLTLPITLEELFWGDAGIGLSIFGSGLAAAGIVGDGNARAGRCSGCRSASARPRRSNSARTA